MEEKQLLKKALLKKALGYTASEVVCEYVLDEDGEKRLAKKKITKKHVAPDISAVKVLLDDFSDNFDCKSKTDEQLMQERERLLNLLKEGDADGNC